MAAESGDTVTVHALARYWAIPRSTLYKLVQDGKLPGQKVSKRWLGE